MASSSSKGGSSRTTSKFGFDVTKPVKRGFLNKQGKTVQRFKNRLFVLYPGFLVYYDEETKWRRDYTRGDTLESRLGAIKLKGGRCSIPPSHGVSKECEFPFVLHAPDPINKRDAFLLDCASAEERESWVQAIEGAIPKSKS